MVPQKFPGDCFFKEEEVLELTKSLEDELCKSHHMGAILACDNENTRTVPKLRVGVGRKVDL